MNILFADIETSPILCYTWGTWDQRVANNQVVEDWSILGVGWAKDDGPVVYADCSQRRSPRDDRGLLKLIWRLLDWADVVVAHNGKSFDVRKINARFIALGMRPPSPYQVVDTKIIAKRVGMFTSGKLDWLAPLAGSRKDKHGEFPGFELWAEVMKRNPRAWAEMRKYCIQDVEALRAVYKMLRAWDKTHPSRLRDDDRPACPSCGSAEVQARGTLSTRVARYRRWHCTACGAWSKGARVKDVKATLKGV